jgi:hypothetical protein
MIAFPPRPQAVVPAVFGAMAPPSAFPSVGAWPRSGAVMKGEESEESEDELGDEEDITAQPLPDEESSFDDFDDEFDDDFEEEDNDPDWDHPEENEPLPPPAKGPSKKK